MEEGQEGECMEGRKKQGSDAEERRKEERVKMEDGRESECMWKGGRGEGGGWEER